MNWWVHEWADRCMHYGHNTPPTIVPPLHPPGPPGGLLRGGGAYMGCWLRAPLAPHWSQCVQLVGRGQWLIIGGHNGGGECFSSRFVSYFLPFSYLILSALLLFSELLLSSCICSYLIVPSLLDLLLSVVSYLLFLSLLLSYLLISSVPTPDQDQKGILGTP